MSSRSYSTPLLGIAAAATATTFLGALYYKFILQQSTKKIASGVDDNKPGEDVEESPATTVATTATTTTATGESAAFMTNSRGILLSTKDDEKEPETVLVEEDNVEDVTKKEETNPLAKMWKSFTDQKPFEEKEEEPDAVLPVEISAEVATKEISANLDTAAEIKEEKKPCWASFGKNPAAEDVDDNSKNGREQKDKVLVGEPTTPLVEELKNDEAPKSIFGFTIGSPIKKKIPDIEETALKETPKVDESKDESKQEEPAKKSFFGFGAPKEAEPAEAETNPAADNSTRQEAVGGEKTPDATAAPAKKSIFGFSMPLKKVEESIIEKGGTDEAPEAKMSIFGFSMPSKKEVETSAINDTTKQTLVEEKTAEEKPESAKKIFGFTFPSKQETARVEIPPIENVTTTETPVAETTAEEKPESAKKLFGFTLPSKKETTTADESPIEKDKKEEAPVVDKVAEENSVSAKTLFGFTLPSKKEASVEVIDAPPTAEVAVEKPESLQEGSSNKEPVKNKFFGLEMPAAKRPPTESTDTTAAETKLEEPLDSPSPEIQTAVEAATAQPKKKRQSFLGAFLNPPPPSPRKDSETDLFEDKSTAIFPSGLQLTEAADSK